MPPRPTPLVLLFKASPMHRNIIHPQIRMFCPMYHKMRNVITLNTPLIITLIWLPMKIKPPPSCVMISTLAPRLTLSWPSTSSNWIDNLLWKWNLRNSSRLLSILDARYFANIFTFYTNLRHINASFNILFLPLEEITKETSTYKLTPHNCLGYANIKQAMSTALYLKLIGTDYFKGFTQAPTYIRATSANSNGFQLLYRILKLIHSWLRQANEVLTRQSHHQRTKTSRMTQFKLFTRY